MISLKIIRVVLGIFLLSYLVGDMTVIAQQNEFEIGQTIEVATSGQNLNLRSGPGTNYSVVTSLASGTRMTVIGGPKSAGDYIWWEIEGLGVSGWVAGAFLQPANEQISSSDSTIHWPLPAPWPAGVTLHAAGDGFGYGPNGGSHGDSDLYAMDFNGNPDTTTSPVEADEKDLLVLAVADGCVMEDGVTYSKGYYNRDGEWKGNYGWMVVVSHYGGYKVRYAHLKEKPLIRPTSLRPTSDCPNFVTQGQPIGQIAGTGTENNSAVHLHFAISQCVPASNPCSIDPIRPEPMENAQTLPTEGTKEKPEKPQKVTSENFSVGYESIQSEALTDPSKLVYHPEMVEEYIEFGGQKGLFGRVISPVERFNDTNIFLQHFLPKPDSTDPAFLLLENEGKAYILPQLIFEEYNKTYSDFGTINSSVYQTPMSDGESGWRSDFSQASLVLTSDKEPIVWDEKYTEWEAQFCPRADQFDCQPILRRDPYIDFSFQDSNNPGPLRQSEGFSAVWTGTLDGGLFTRASLDFEIQGHATIYIDNRQQGEKIDSEDELVQGTTRPTWHVGRNTFRIEFWQIEGKPASLKIEVQQGLLPQAHAFFSQGTLSSQAYLPPDLGSYADFELPPYPDELPSDDFPPGLDDQSSWWQQFTENLQNRVMGWWESNLDKLNQNIEAWWQEQLERLRQSLEEAIVQTLDAMVQQFLEQCCAAPLVPAVILSSAALFKRRHLRGRSRK